VKRAIHKPSSTAPQPLDAGTCDAARLAEQVLLHTPYRVPVTPEWQAENRAKQKAYEKRRRAWLRQCRKLYPERYRD
jgi:hypothetical protein